MQIDQQLETWFTRHQSPWATTTCHVLMWLGTSLPGTAGVAVILALVCWRRHRLDVLVAVVVTAAVVLEACSILKDSFCRLRPPGKFAQVEVYGYSMPSSSQALAVVVLTILSALLPRAGRARRCGMALLVSAGCASALSLLYVGAHWFTDLLAGSVVGLLFGWLVCWVLGRRVQGRQATSR